jgi:hypothetical protein
MTPLEYAQEAIAIGNLYQQIAQQMGDYLQANIVDMSKDPAFLSQFTDDQTRILSYSNTFYSLGDSIAFGNDQAYFQQVDQATQVINANIKTIQTTDKWINFAGAVISLGASIVTGNGGGIVTSVETILATFDVNLPGSGNPPAASRTPPKPPAFD